MRHIGQPPPRVLYLHGLAARPGGWKPQYLTAEGFQVLNPALPDDNLDEALAIAQAELEAHAPDVIVGSSRGAAIAMLLDCGERPLILLVPAWRHFAVPPRVPPGTRILHSPHDTLIPLADSQLLVEANGLPADALTVIGEDHRMNDAAALAKLAELIRATHTTRRDS